MKADRYLVEAVMLRIESWNWPDMTDLYLKRHTS